MKLHAGLLFCCQWLAALSGQTPSPCRELKKVESRITIRKWKRIRIRQTPGPCRELKKGQSRIRDQDHGDSRPLLETEKGRIKDLLKTKHWETPGACRKMKMSELGIRNRKRINQGFGSEMKPRKTPVACWKLRLCWRYQRQVLRIYNTLSRH